MGTVKLLILSYVCFNVIDDFKDITVEPFHSLWSEVGQNNFLEAASLPKSPYIILLKRINVFGKLTFVI